jgi:Fimbrial assembly protein (PilN)
MAQNINLLPTGTRRRGRFTVVGVATMGLLLAGGIGTLQGLGAMQLRNGRAEYKSVMATVDRLEHELAVGPVTSRPRQDQLDRDEAAIAALEAVVVHLDAGALGDTLGFADRLEALARSTTAGVWLSGVRFDNRSSDLVLEGRALEAARVPVYLATLKANPLLAGTEFTKLEMSPAEDAGKRSPAGTVRFKISTAVAGSPLAKRRGLPADLPAPAAPAVAPATTKGTPQ